CVSLYCFLIVLSFLVFLCFFFSSRRRHTRSTRDWSSDVCSSDLLTGWWGLPLSAQKAHFVLLNDGRDLVGDQVPAAGSFDPHRRSEERRVGKDCRSRWSSKQ